MQLASLRSGTSRKATGRRLWILPLKLPQARNEALFPFIDRSPSKSRFRPTPERNCHQRNLSVARTEERRALPFRFLSSSRRDESFERVFRPQSGRVSRSASRNRQSPTALNFLCAEQRVRARLDRKVNRI